MIITESKQLKLVSFEQIIKRCPFCLKDTQQTAYYAEKPDLSVTARIETTPPIFIKVLPKMEHQYSWDVMAKCSECGLMYRISGIPLMKTKEIPPGAKLEYAKIGLICCDICYHECYNYRIGDMFIKLSDGGNVYLCEEHAAEAARGKDGDYPALSRKLSEWKTRKDVLRLVKTKQGLVIALRDNGGVSSSMLHILAGGEMQLGELKSKLGPEKQKDCDAYLEYLKRMKFVKEAKSGLLVKKSLLQLSPLGKQVAESC